MRQPPRWRYETQPIFFFFFLSPLAAANGKKKKKIESPPPFSSSQMGEATSDSIEIPSSYSYRAMASVVLAHHHRVTVGEIKRLRNETHWPLEL